MGKPRTAANDVFTKDDEYREDVAEQARVYTVIDDAYRVRLAIKDENSPLAKVLERAMESARTANLALIVCDPEDAKRIRALQWKITRYHDLVGYARAIMEDGKNEQDALTDEELARTVILLGHEDQQMKDV